MKTMEPTTTGMPASRRRYGMIAVVVLALVAGGWLLLRNDEKTATDHVLDVAAEMRNDDMDRLVEIFGFEGSPNSMEYRFIDWHIGWNAQPDFSDVVETPLEGGRTSFRAVVTYSDESFYSRAVGETLTTSVNGIVNKDGTIDVSSWPPPNGLTTVEGELRPWVEANRPEFVDEMFGYDFSGIHFSRRSGELRMEVLDDFLATR